MSFKNYSRLYIYIYIYMGMYVCVYICMRVLYVCQFKRQIFHIEEHRAIQQYNYIFNRYDFNCIDFIFKYMYTIMYSVL